ACEETALRAIRIADVEPMNAGVPQSGDAHPTLHVVQRSAAYDADHVAAGGEVTQKRPHTDSGQDVSRVAPDRRKCAVEVDEQRDGSRASKGGRDAIPLGE